MGGDDESKDVKRPDEDKEKKKGKKPQIEIVELGDTKNEVSRSKSVA